MKIEIHVNDENIFRETFADDADELEVLSTFIFMLRDAFNIAKKKPDKYEEYDG